MMGFERLFLLAVGIAGVSWAFVVTARFLAARRDLIHVFAECTGFVREYPRDGRPVSYPTFRYFTPDGVRHECVHAYEARRYKPGQSYRAYVDRFDQSVISPSFDRFRSGVLVCGLPGIALIVLAVL